MRKSLFLLWTMLLWGINSFAQQPSMKGVIPMPNLEGNIPETLVENGNSYELKFDQRKYSISREGGYWKVTGNIADYKGKVGMASARHVAYVPGMGLVGWYDNERDSTHERYGNITWILRAADGFLEREMGLKSFGFIYRRGSLSNPLVADTTLILLGMKLTHFPYIDQKNSKKNSMIKTWLEHDYAGGTAGVYLFHGTKLFRKWDGLADLANGLTRTLFIRQGKEGFIQFGHWTADSSSINLYTLYPDWKRVDTTREVMMLHASRSTPKQDDFYTWNGSIERSRQRRILAPEHYIHHLVVPHPVVQDWFVLLNNDGSMYLPEQALGLVPVGSRKTAGLEYNSRRKKEFTLVEGFVVAYQPKENEPIWWGWSDGELKTATGPIWKEWYVHEALGIPLVDPKLLVARQKNNLWQAYTLPSYNTSFYSSGSAYQFLNPTTFDVPNTFKGRIQPSGNPGEAILKAELAVKKMAEEIQNNVKAAWNEYLAIKAKQDKEMQELNAKYAAQQQANKPTGVYRPSTWQGFTYTPQTTARYNQAVNSSEAKMKMQQFKQQLNAKIKRY
jgi:hypothetical protein